jgi:uncharacterized membrane protein HdeD (DUF308 family)
MNTESTGNSACESSGLDSASCRLLRREFSGLQKEWWWFFLLGILLETCGMAAIVFPALTAAVSLITPVVLGVLLMATGIATMLGSYWAGKWSGMLLHLLVGILYLACGFLIVDSPGKADMAITMLIAAMFIVLGIFRIVGAMIIHYPKWGWSLLNGVVTLLAGIIIYRHFPESALWVIGLLVGVEMLFSGWMWIMLALGVRDLPAEASN